MDTYATPSINGGRPFAFGKHLITPAGTMAGLEAKTHALKRLGTGLKDLPEALQQEAIKEARSVALMEQTNAMLFHALCAVDPTLQRKGQESVIAILPLEAYTDLMKLLGKGVNGPLESAAVTPPSTAA